VVGLAVARRLGLVEEEVEQAALLHDIGKMGIPDSILRKPGPLDEEERELMREHPGIGERIVGSVEGLSLTSPP
jgi:HD-GYP domain-containing protein (c-di-GMP phosphodiesterase class II)